MLRELQVCLVVAAALIFLPFRLYAQNPPVSEKLPMPAKVMAAVKPKETLDNIKLSSGGVVVVVDDLKEGLALQPKMILMAIEEYQKLLERLAALEKQLKAEKKSAHVCKLTGRLESEYALLRAEFTFMTEQPRSAIFLGLAGAYLMDEGDLDSQVPLLDFGAEGFLIKVEKEGTHRLILNIKVPLALKRSPAGGGGGDRGFELGLPGAAVTTMALDFPPGIKEIRWNDTLEKPNAPNHWDLALGKIKKINVSWKEPVSLPGNAPLLTADSQIAVKLEENHVLINADITLEDLRGQTREWQLHLPPNARVEVKTAAGLGFELLNPDAKRLRHVIRLAEPSAERIVVNVQLRYARPFLEPRLPIGPFVVPGAYRQESILTVSVAPEALRGQRLIFHRTGEIYPRDIPKGSDVTAIYKLWTNPGTDGSAAKAPLELELITENNPAEAGLDHFLNIRPSGQNWLIDVVTTIQMKNRADFLDIQLPRVAPPRLDALGISVGASFPAVYPWAAFAPAWGKNMPPALPLSFSCDDDNLKLVAPDGRRLARLSWNRSQGNDVKLMGKYFVPAGTSRFTIELPRPLNVVDRGAKIIIKLPDHLEFQANVPGSEGSTADKHETRISLDTFPQRVDIAWKPYHMEFPVTAVTDIWLHERGAEVKHQLSFTVPKGSLAAGSPKSIPLRFRIPAAIHQLAVVSGGKLVLHDPAKEAAWIIPNAEPLTRADIQLLYDFSLPKKEDPARKISNRPVEVPLIWPEKTTRETAKVRVWSEPGTRPMLADASLGENVWKDFGIEIVPGRDILPALVAQGTGLNLPLSLRLVDATTARLASLVCERGLIQVVIDEEGWHTYRARYLVQKLNARQLDVEFPMPAVNCQLNIWLDNQKINNWEPLDASPSIARIPIYPRLYQQPVVLEIEYKLPANFGESQRSWRTTLVAPQFRGEFSLGRIRWQVSLPFSWVALVPERTLEYRWGLQGWLLGTEPTVTSADLEFWLTGRESKDTSMPVSLVFAQTGQENVKLLHLPRQLWLLLCSGALLAIGLALNILPLRRPVFWLAILGLGFVFLIIGLFWPEWLPTLAYGCQPGGVVLIILLGIQWMLQENYRRRLVFMPGLPREKVHSSLVRAGSGGARREPSTIDGPSPSASSIPPASPSAN